METVSLFYLKRADKTVKIDLFFNDVGQLILEGQDIGKMVEDTWGDSDYEYSIMVNAVEVLKLYELFDVQNGNKQDLLNVLKARFGVNEAYSLFQNFLMENDINYQGHTY